MKGLAKSIYEAMMTGSGDLVSVRPCDQTRDGVTIALEIEPLKPAPEDGVIDTRISPLIVQP